MSKYERLLAEINLLKTKKSLNATDLSRELGISKRTIYRDMLALSRSQIPVYFDKGYKLLSDSFFPTLNFNLEEYLVIRQGLKSSPVEYIPYLSKIAKSALGKIEANLNQELKSKIKINQDVLYIKPKIYEKPLVTNTFFEMIEKTILDQRVINVNYQPKSVLRYTCEVEPYSLVFRCGGWILCGFCLSHQNFHLFNISKFKKVMLLDRRFERRPDYSLSGILENICRECLQEKGGCGTFEEQMKEALPEKILR